jgi:hypothetical protein
MPRLNFSLPPSVFGVDSPSLTVELLELADQYMLDHLKEMCEARLQVRSCFLLSMPIDPNIRSPPLE